MSKTNAAVLQETIEECEKKILKMEARNQEISQLLQDAENGTERAQAGAQKWERKRSECFEFVRNGLNRLNPRSALRETYLQRIRSVLDGYEAESISEIYRELQREIYMSADELESELAHNQAQLQALREELRYYMQMQETL